MNFKELLYGILKNKNKKIKIIWKKNIIFILKNNNNKNLKNI